MVFHPLACYVSWKPEDLITWVSNLVHHCGISLLIMLCEIHLKETQLLDFLIQLHGRASGVEILLGKHPFPLPAGTLVWAEPSGSVLTSPFSPVGNPQSACDETSTIKLVLLPCWILLKRDQSKTRGFNSRQSIQHCWTRLGGQAVEKTPKDQICTNQSKIDV